MSAHAAADPQHLISRQVSWVEFNRRVLEVARDTTQPLLERLRFLAISGENLDGFFMKRVGGLHREVELGVPRSPVWPLSATEELAAVAAQVRLLQAEQAACWRDELRPALAEAGVRLLDYDHLSPSQREHVDAYFEEQLFAILTPLAVDPGRPFPFISNLSLSLAVVLRYEDTDPLFARVKVPANRPRWIPLPEAGCYVPAEQVITNHLDRLFRRMTVVSAHPFRVTRSADVARDDAAADDLLDYAVDLVRERRFAPVVRLEVDSAMPAGPRELLTSELSLTDNDLFSVDGLLGHADLMPLAEAKLPGLRWPAWNPQPHPQFPADPNSPPEDLFAAIRRQDILVHHPYHSYKDTVVRFVRAAAADPQVLAIKQSVYRTSQRSNTLEALLTAAEAQKEVTALIELKARLDEAANIAWAQRLEASGIHTSYGFPGLKTHTRATLVVRQEADGLRRYVHLGTGDYNDDTTRNYTDLGLFTASPDIGADVGDFFNFLTGYSDQPAYRRLVPAPTDMRSHFLACIGREAELARNGRTGRIVAMMNALVDAPLAHALYDASSAGVQIQIIVRGECCLRPGLPKVSENIRVRSVLGPFLEHARVFSFANDGDPQVYLGTADWMYRNLDQRIELVVPVADSDLRADLIGLLDLYWHDTALCWELAADGHWTRLRPKRKAEPAGVQQALMARARAGQRLR